MVTQSRVAVIAVLEAARDRVPEQSSTRSISGSRILRHRKTPAAVLAGRMGVGWGMDALDPDSGIHLARNRSELGPVHLPADVLALTSPEARLLRRAGRDSDHDLERLFLDGVAHDDRPREEAQCLDEAGQPGRRDPEPAAEIPGGHAGHAPPDALVHGLSRPLAGRLRGLDEPERVYDTVVPEEKVDVFAQLVPIHHGQPFLHRPSLLIGSAAYYLWDLKILSRHYRAVKRKEASKR